MKTSPAAGFSRVTPLCRPKALPPGGTIGLINPSSPVETDLLNAGIAVLEARGFHVVVAPHVRDRDGHHAGSPEDRAADFTIFYADPAIDILWCARGGSSACRLWPLLDWGVLAALPPKMVIGYSDTTSLLIPLNQRVGTIALHGPLVFELGTLSPDLLDWQLGLLQDVRPVGVVPGLASETLVPGSAEGLLCGGCLSLVAATLGTPYQIDTAGKLLLIEDIDEAPHRIERFLVQFAEAGLLALASGFIVGQSTGADDTRTLPMRQLWSDLLTPYNKPTVLGFPFGHVPANYALPLGTFTRLDADARSLTLLESAVA
ncbi:MAG: S66 peptidase family protein [Janthinobacterium lividum]